MEFKTNNDKSDSQTVSLRKEYKYKVKDAFATADIIATADCDWTNDSVTITNFNHTVVGDNSFGDIDISNEKNTILVKAGSAAEAEAAGNIAFIFDKTFTQSSELMAYRLRLIVHADSPQSAVIKLIM
ncbi:MAG: hypothetical protein PHW03_03140 [Eubacteriales bacterium]|nr:hypothetical protein [Eubacteriales bacterium]